MTRPLHGVSCPSVASDCHGNGSRPVRRIARKPRATSASSSFFLGSTPDASLPGSTSPAQRPVPNMERPLEWLGWRAGQWRLLAALRPTTERDDHLGSRYAKGITRPTADCGRGATQLAASKVLRSFIPPSRSANYWPWRTIVPSSSYRRGDLIAGACLRVGKKDEGVRQESKYVPRQPDSPSTAAC